MNNETGLEVSRSQQQTSRYRATLVSDETSLAVKNLTASLKRIGYAVVAEISTQEFSTYHVGQETAPNRADIIIVLEPHPCRGFFETLHAFQCKIPCAVVMISDDSTKETIEQAARHGVQAYLTEVPADYRLAAVFDAAMARHKVFNDVSTELIALKRTLAERKIVERAKGILMHRKSLDEPAAYRAMQKMAMNRNVKLVELAHSMISASEILD